jgi:hypothetical protein
VTKRFLSGPKYPSLDHTLITSHKPHHFLTLPTATARPLMWTRRSLAILLGLSFRFCLEVVSWVILPRTSPAAWGGNPAFASRLRRGRFSTDISGEVRTNLPERSCLLSPRGFVMFISQLTLRNLTALLGLGFCFCLEVSSWSRS